MNDILYHNRFFRNLEEAKQFQKEHGYGVIYKFTRKQNGDISMRSKSYWYEFEMSSKSFSPDDYPYVVAWNEVIKSN